MNKLLTFPGTMPVYLGDLDFMQAAAKASIGQLAQALMGSGNASQNAILQGVTFSISNSQISFTSGVVVIAGEVLPVAAGVVSASAVSDLYFHVQSSLSGTRTFKDGQSHDCYDIRSAILNTTSSGGVAVSSMPRFQNILNYDYTFVSCTGFVASGRLARRNGSLLFNLDLDAVDMVTTGSKGEILFQVNPNEQVAFPVSFTFPVLMTFDGAGYVAECEIVFGVSQIKITLTMLEEGPGINQGVCCSVIPMIV